MTGTDLEALADRALGIAKKVAGPGVELKIDVHRNAAANVRFARNAITTSGSSDEISVSISMMIGKRHAAATINQTSDDALRSLADRALAMAKLSPEDPESMPLLAPQKYAPAPPAFDDEVARMDATARAAVASRACALGDKSDTWIAGLVQRSSHAYALRTSSGIAASHRDTSLSYSTTARTKDGTGSGWAGREAWRVDDLDDRALSQTAIDKARASASPKPLAAGKYTVVLEPAAVQEMLAFLVGSMDQRSADEGRSFFSGKVGEKLFPDAITLKSDPGSPQTPYATFDGEGLPLDPQTWIEAGRVKQLGMSRYWAAKQAKPPTGDHSVFHLVGGNAASIDDLVKGTKRGLLVTRFWYTRMLEPQTVMLTGLTRDGVFLIENGKVTQSVQNFRYNESPVNVLKNADAMTRETFRLRSWGGIWKVPALRTNEFTMASVSAAV
jgi:predicted Zn-dependent protease